MFRNRLHGLLFIALTILSQMAHSSNWVFNNPYPSNESKEKIYYTSFGEQPKTLDPAKSYSANEYQFIMQIYEPPLQYDYLTRPYALVPLTAKQMPTIRYLDGNGVVVSGEDTSTISRTVYTIQINLGILYQPHPAFAKTNDGHYRYHQLAADYLAKNNIMTLEDFKFTSTRELVADDYIYQIKRLADPKNNSPIFGLMSEYIEGFREYGATLPRRSSTSQQIDLRQYPLSGVKKIDDYTFEITIKGNYPQFNFWLAMPFFSPIPWEAERFYSQPDMDDKNIGFGWYPIGTGPFVMSENNPNSQMVLDKNPNYRAVYFNAKGSVEDEKKGYLNHFGKKLPLIDKAVYVLEKETIPRWNKFLQGYYDLSGISADSFDQAIQIDPSGDAVLSTEMQAQGIHLEQVNEPSIYYLGFNMLDPVVGGKSLRAKKLRQAISNAVNYDEFIGIFYNGRGKAAQGPIPPGIFGYKEGAEGINPYVYTWSGATTKRRPISYALQLMNEAGYPKGIDPATGNPLILHYDVASTGSGEDKELLNWMRKQFARIGIDLNIRSTQYNRFQEKMRHGNAQIFSWGWNADYPDPENFLFLLYGPNSKVKHGGENASNYQNAEFDRLFEVMKSMPNNEARQHLINKMLNLVREDAPWVWGINSQNFILRQQWMSAVKPNTISLNTLKFMSIDIDSRNELRNKWNKPVLWPIFLFIILIILLLAPFVYAYHLNQNRRAPRIDI